MTEASPTIVSLGATDGLLESFFAKPVPSILKGSE